MRLSGTPLAAGIGIGITRSWRPAAAGSVRRTVDPAEVPAEVERLRAAVAAARAELAALRDQVAARAGAEQAAILEAQMWMLDDPALVGEAEERIRSRHLSAHAAVDEVAAGLAGMLAALDDPYLRERAADVQDVARRLQGHLAGAAAGTAAGSGSLSPGPAGGGPAGADPVILVAADLPPSVASGLDPARVAGLILGQGGPTSHTAILARGLGIPAVAVGDRVTAIPDGVTAVVDGDAGLALVDPPAAELAAYRRRRAAAREEEERGAAVGPAATRDGHRVHLVANVGSAAEARAARARGAEGVGLFRTEFLFLDRAAPPTLEEQRAAYAAAVRAMAPHPVVIRTLDIGGDKEAPYLGIPAEANPFLGRRGIRYSMGRPELFGTQVAAILLAAADAGAAAGGAGPVRLMIPMVAHLEELLWARQVVAEEADRLGVPPVPVGMMVETPAAALMADRFAPHADFFSIGTNDLTQYTLAVDRLNPQVAPLYDPLHPAVLRLVARVVAAGRPTAVCGELAADPLGAVILVGLGIGELSMAAAHLPRVRAALRRISLAEARTLAAQALACDTPQAVRALPGGPGTGGQRREPGG